jgi:hypothetical protein
MWVSGRGSEAFKRYITRFELWSTQKTEEINGSKIKN